MLKVTLRGMSGNIVIEITKTFWKTLGRFPREISGEILEEISKEMPTSIPIDFQRISERAPGEIFKAVEESLE